jgi:hypothetical protein
LFTFTADAEIAEWRSFLICPGKLPGQIKSLWRLKNFDDEAMRFLENRLNPGPYAVRGFSPILQKKSSLGVLCASAVKILMRS